MATSGDIRWPPPGRNDGHQWGISWPPVGRNRWPLTDVAVTTGIFALGGVVVGGFASAAVNYGLGRREERREARAAARLVLEEATQITHALAALLAHRQWRPIEFAETNQWDGSRVSLAYHLRHADWRCVVSAYEDLQRLLGWVQANDVTGELDDSDEAFVAAVHSAMSHAIAGHLIQLAVHGPQRRRLALRYHRLRNRWRQRRLLVHSDEAQERLVLPT
jgi:hypothetical protein